MACICEYGTSRSTRMNTCVCMFFNVHVVSKTYVLSLKGPSLMAHVIWTWFWLSSFSPSHWSRRAKQEGPIFGSMRQFGGPGHVHYRLYILTSIHSYIHTFIHSYIHTFIHSYIHLCMHSYIHPYIHPCIHTYIRTCMT